MSGTLKGYRAIILCYEFNSPSKSDLQSIAVLAVSGRSNETANRLIELLLEYYEMAEKEMK